MVQFASYLRCPRINGPNVLPYQFQIVAAVLASDWCQKTFVFFCPIRAQQTLELFRVFLYAKYMNFSYSPCLSWLFSEVLCTRWKIPYQNKMQGKTFGISAIISPLNKAGPFAGIITEAYLKVCEIYIYRFLRSIKKKRIETRENTLFV